MGSVKDLIVENEATDQSVGWGIFDFSDRYSVFDWGEMPDHIPNKGAALCMMAAWNFEQLSKEGAQTHYLGIVVEQGVHKRITSIDQIKEPTIKMAVSLSRVVEPVFVNGSYDYSYFINGQGKINNFVVPLEVIYRNGAPKGSSLFKTIDELERKGETDKLAKLLDKYGLTEKPQPGQLFPKTGYDFTTKFEPTDRKIDDEVAYLISGLTEEQFKQLKEIRESAVNTVKKRGREGGLEDYDGKHEYRFFAGRISIADVFGTLDENRFMFSLNGKNVQVSKEFLRQYYKIHQREWFEATEKAKVSAKEREVEDWITLCEIKPMNLEPRLVSLVGEMYAAASDRYTGFNFFKNARPLEKVMEDLLPYME